MYSNKLNILTSSLKRSFAKIKEEFDMHLSSINDNTKEIAANAERMDDIDTRIEKLSEKLDEILMILSQLPNDTKTYLVKPLTINEKQVLMAIYASSKPISHSRIAQNLNLSESLVNTYVEGIISKKIPLIITYKDGKPYLALDNSFKEKQAKENLLGIDQTSLNETFEK
ncbi:hypothetical protein KY328_03705 [Candidatus Woesearchaeota archaeon]|nr:hypothetical protein [Candidatus Woesearchaeota archaeon]MBW3022001.1 hypothetical protein [Candidatus Woesearchaeota archaeon]